MWPRVSVLWVNYNSSHILPFVKKVLLALSELDYPDYEVIVVDNASSDGSWSVLRDFIRTHVAPRVETRVIRLSRNYGFAGGYNAAYAARSAESKYVVLVNNDAIPVPDMLKKYVEFMEKYSDVGAAQGVILGFGKYSSIVDSCGGFIDSFLNLYFPYVGKEYGEILELLSRRPYIEVSYVEGTMPIYRVEAVERVSPFKNRLYISAGFMYYLEDVLLSILLWMHGYKSVVIPFTAGHHLRSAIIRKHVGGKASYYFERNRLALVTTIDPPIHYLILIKYLRRTIYSPHGRINPHIVIDGLRLGRQLKTKPGRIHIGNVPQKRLSVADILRRIL